MRRLLWMPGRGEATLVRLEQADAAGMATIHAEDFARPWSDGEFAALLGQDGVFGFAARPGARARPAMAGFVLARLAADEGEILSIAVARAHRRKGLGRRLMETVLRELHAQRAEALYLEVDEANIAAVTLYRMLGFRDVGRRHSYYHGRDRSHSDAIVMRRDLR